MQRGDAWHDGTHRDEAGRGDIMNKPMRGFAKKLYQSSATRNRVCGGVVFVASVVLCFSVVIGFNSYAQVRDLTNFQAVFRNVDVGQIDELKALDEVDRVGISKDLGTLTLPADGDLLLYYDETMLELTNSKIIEGSYPHGYGEVLIEKGYTVAGEAATVGDSLNIEYADAVSGAMTKDVFVVSGIMDTPYEESASAVHNVYAAKARAEDAGGKHYSASLLLRASGSYSVSETRSLINTIGERIGVAPQDIQYNVLNLETNTVFSGTTGLLLFLAFLILLITATVLYSIFNISLSRQTNQIGLMRLLGLTSTQVRQVITYQGKVISLRYIPVGIVCGLLVAYAANTAAWRMPDDLVLAVLLAVAVCFVVMFSVGRPARRAARISPIAAKNYREYRFRHDKRSLKKKPFGIRALAVRNVLREKKRFVLSLTVLSLTGILFVVATSIIVSASPEAKTDYYFPNEGRFILQIEPSLLYDEASMAKVQQSAPLDAELRETILAIPGVRGLIEKKEALAKLNDLPDLWEEYVNIEGTSSLAGLTGEGDPQTDDSGEEGIVVNTSSTFLKNVELQYGVGDKVELLMDDGTVNVFTVVHTVDVAYPTAFFLPNTVLDDVFGRNTTASFEVMIEADAYDDVKSSLEYLTSTAGVLQLVSYDTLLEENKRAFSLIARVAYFFIIVFAAFGMVSTLNTIVANVEDSRRDYTVMRKIGLRIRELRQLVSTEIACHVLTCGSISILLGYGIGHILSQNIKKIPGFFYLSDDLSVLPGLAIALMTMTIYLLLTVGIKKFLLARHVNLGTENTIKTERF
jgi:putative ABC transport system permease protein